LKVKIYNPITSISSYNYGYNNYDSNYTTSLKYKHGKFSIKIKYYPSYIYNPIFSDIFYPYNRYYQFGYNNYYNRPNYYNFYNQNTNIIQNIPTLSQNTFNSLNLSPEYNAQDWIPSYRPYFDHQSYIQKINLNLESIKIYSQCCRTWCAIVIQNSNDGLNSAQNKKRIYIDIILKNYAFFDASLLNASQKKCLVKSIQENNYSNVKDDNIFSKCEIKSPYDIIPIKQRCLKSMKDHCKDNGFSNLIDMSANYSENSEKTNNQCLQILDCLNISGTPTEEQIQSCGSKIYSLFTINAMKPAFKKFIMPCADNNTFISNGANSTPSRITSMLQKFSKQNSQGSNTTASNNSNFINLHDFSTEERMNLQNVNQQASSHINNKIAIDNNTASKTNTDTSTDADFINSGTDKLVESAIVTPDTHGEKSNEDSDGSYNNDDGSYDNRDPQYRGGFSSGAFNNFSYIKTLFLMIAFFFL